MLDETKKQTKGADSWDQAYSDDLINQAKQYAGGLAREEMEGLIMKEKVYKGLGQEVPKAFSDHVDKRVNATLNVIAATGDLKQYVDTWGKRKEDMGIGGATTQGSTPPRKISSLT